VGRWQIDPAHSEIQFVARHMMIAKVRGRFREFEGWLDVAERLEDSSVEVVIHAASIDTGDEQRDDHLRSPDFLGVERFPQITFRSTSVAPGRDPDRYVVVGDLSIRGVTRPVTLDVELEGVATDPWGGTRMGFVAVGEINREDFDVTWNQALETGASWSARASGSSSTSKPCCTPGRDGPAGHHRGPIAVPADRRLRLPLRLRDDGAGGPERQHRVTLSKVMTWVAADRGRRLALVRGHEDVAKEWRVAAEEIHADICAQAVDARGVFTQHYDTDLLDASLLLLPLFRFLLPDDPRIVATVNAVADDLAVSGFLRRYPPVVADGLVGVEGTFMCCSFWLVSALVEIGELPRRAGCASACWPTPRPSASTPRSATRGRAATSATSRRRSRTWR
jgi:polyisoprenoid-binding protein YceI